MRRADGRLNRDFHADGLSELMLGASYVFIAAYIALNMLGADWPFLSALAPGFIPLLFLVVIWLKRRITAPRTGDPRPPLTGYALPLLGVSALLFLLTMLSPEDAPIFDEGSALFLGGIAAVTFLIAGRGLKRFYGYAAVALVAGFGASFLDPDVGALVVCLVTGLVLLVSGARVLRRYLAQHPPPAPG